MPSLNHLTAAEAARQIADGTISAEALVRDCLDRIEAREKDVRAWVHLDADAALAQARAVDRADLSGPLAGVPIAVKDVIDTRDMPAQYGSPIYRDYRPRADAACVALSRRAGAVVFGKTVTTEFATRKAGPTRNPHNLAHTPGGSSSGSAAAVADFMVPLAFGTQTGGSNIRPAAYCGIVGYKPSFGTINRAGLKSLSESLDTIGVMARTVEDCALLVHAVSSRAMPDFQRRLPKPPRIGLCRTSRWSDASPATHAAIETAASSLARAGAQVCDVAFSQAFDGLFEAQELVMNYEAARSLSYERFNHEASLSPHLRDTLQAHWDMPRSRYDAALLLARECRNAYAEFFSDVDVLLTPSAPDEAPKGLESTGSSLFNRMWTLLGGPCVTIPSVPGPQGLPLGVQIVGRHDDDARVLQAAHWAAHALG